MESSIATRIHNFPYCARRDTAVSVPLLTFSTSDNSASAVQERQRVIMDSIAAQEETSIIRMLNHDTLMQVCLEISLSANKTTNVPCAIALSQVAKTCRYFALCYKDIKTDIDAVVDRHDEADATSGRKDMNLYKSRFFLRSIKGGRHLLLKEREIDKFKDAADGASIIIYRDVNPCSDRRFHVVCALAVPIALGFICTPFDIDAGVRLLSGHDIKCGIFHNEDLRMRRARVYHFPVYEDDEVDGMTEMHTEEEKQNDRLVVSLNVTKSRTVFEGVKANELISTTSIETSKTTCEPLSERCYHMSTKTHHSLCVFFGYGEPTILARCRTGESDDECHILEKNTVEFQRGPKTIAKRCGAVEVSNIQPPHKRRQVGARADSTNYVLLDAQSHITARGRYKRTAPAWQRIKDWEDATNLIDDRIAHDTDSEAEDEKDAPVSAWVGGRRNRERADDLLLLGYSR